MALMVCLKTEGGSVEAFINCTYHIHDAENGGYLVGDFGPTSMQA